MCLEKSVDYPRLWRFVLRDKGMTANAVFARKVLTCMSRRTIAMGKVSKIMTVTRLADWGLLSEAAKLILDCLDGFGDDVSNLTMSGTRKA